MANNIGTLVIAPVRPQSTEDTYPVAYASELCGGYYQVSSLVEMYAIPAERRIEGLICWVTDTQKSYRLVGGIDNSNWQELVIDISSTGYTDAQAQAAVGSLLTSSGTFYFEYVPLGYIAGHVKLATSGGLAITSTGIFLEDVPITPGMYTKVVVNSRGQVIEGYLLTESDLPFHTHDDRYYTESEIEDKFTSTGSYYSTIFSSTGHLHDDRYYTEVEVDTKFTSTGNYYTSIFSSTGHLHDDRYYTEVEVDSKFTSTGNYYAAHFSSTGHIHDDRYYTESEVDSKFTSTGAYYSSVFFGHTHDDRYYTKEISDTRFSSTGHTHDDRYYTESEIDDKFTSTGVYYQTIFSPTEHTHDDRYYTESEIETKFSSTGSYYSTIFSSTGHLHDDRYLQDITNESIGDLKDVDLTGLAHNNILKYNSTSGHWEVSTSGGGGETYTAGAGLQLVGIEFSVKPDGSTIIVTSSGVKVADNTFATLLHNHNLSDLSDVDNSQRNNGKLLVWNTSTGKHVYIAAGTGSGDMLRAVYDPNDDGVVDVATYATSSGYLEGKRASDFASSTHTHDDRYYTQVEVDGKFTSTGSYYQTIFSSTGHTHDSRYYTQSEIDNKFTSTGVYYTGVFSSTGHIHDDRYYTEVESDNRFSSTGHIHDDRYYTETEADSRFSASSHTHDDRYYTETEVDDKFTSTGAYYQAIFSSTGHTHDDRYYTEVEIDNKFTSTGSYYQSIFSSTGHIHDDRYYTESESDLRYAPQSHTHSHGTLTGLDADDHTQYIRVDGTRNFTDVVSYDSDKVFVTSTALVSKGYVDTQDALIPSVTHEPTGFVSRTDSTISFDSGTRTFTISPTSTTFEVWVDGIKYEKETCQVVINDVLGLWYIYFLTNGTLACGQTVWNFVDGKAPVATVYWNGTTGILADERHGIIMDGMTHRYLHYAIGVRYISGLVGTFTDTSFSISNGIIYDEDIRIEIPTTEQCRVFYRGSGFYQFTSLQGVYYLQSSNILQYDNDGTLASVDNNKYIAMWVFATNTPDCPIHVLVGQRQDTTIANARLYNTYDSLVLYSLPSHEMKVIYRVIIQRTGTSVKYIETQDLRSISNVPSSTYVPTSHSNLSGLLNDDHLQYLRTDGTRELTGNWDAGSYKITAATFESDVVTGTAPLTVASSTLVTNLNADLLDGKHASEFSSTGHIHDHASLTNVGTYTHLQIDSHITSTGHLTTTQKSELVGGGETSLHTHDIRYYTKTEIDGKISSTGHTHDGRYVRRDIYDWYLPTKEELELIYTNLAESELVEFTNGVYSSSTEYDDSNIWSVHFGSGYVSTTPKSDYYYVRACRTFLIAEDEPSLPIGYLTSTGGYIFYVVASGKGTCTYYEVTSQDIDSNNPWSNIQDVEIGSDAQYTAVGFGAQNTQAIISQSGHLFSNAYTCVCYPKSGVSHSSLYNLDRDDHFQYSRIDGSRPFINDIDIQGIKVGAGGGGDSTNTRIGANALDSNLSGTYNTAAGISSLQLLQSGSENAAVGVGALGNLQLGGYNTAIGGGALNLLGYEHETESVNYNTAIGHSAGSSLRNGQNVTCIGYDSQPSSTGAINEITLGNEYVTLVRTFGQIETKIATGTPPFKVSSATLVTNLNVDLLDGKHASEFSSTGHTHADLHSPYTLGTKTIDETNINNNYYIKYDTSSDTLVYSPISGGSLSTLTDVQLDSLSNNQILVYDSTSEKWINSNYTPSSSSTGIVHEALLTSVEGVYSYNLGFIPTDKKNLLVLVNGQAAHPDDYTISEDILTFSTEPLLGGDDIIIKEIGSGYVYETTSSTTSYVLTSSGETVTSQEYSFYAQSSVLTYYLPFGVNQKEDLLIFNGTTLVPYEKYDVSGNVLTFVSGYLTTGALIQLRTLISRQDVTLTSAGYYILSPSDYSITTTSESYVDNKCYIYLTFVPLRKEAIVVTVNGVVLHPDDYSLDSNLVIIAEGVTEVSDVVVVKVVFPSVGLTINEISPDLEQPIQLYHDGTDGHILCSTGDLWIDTVNTSTGQITDGCIRSHGKIYNAVWNDFADFWNVKPGVQAIPGFCYADYGEGLEAPRSKGDSAVIGIYSDTYGYGMGERAGAIPIAVSGFCLAYVDRQYPSGTLLTNDTDGMLRKASLFDILFKRVVAKYIRPECAEYFNGAVKVNGRHWVKVI